MANVEFSGRPEDLEAWQAVQQAIGYIHVKRKGGDSDEERRALTGLRDGLLKAAEALNRPVVTGDVMLYRDMDGSVTPFRVEVLGSGRVVVRATDITTQDNRVVDVDLRFVAGRLMGVM